MMTTWSPRLKNAGLLCLLVGVALLPFLLRFPFSGGIDSAFHVRFAQDYFFALREGAGWPDWDHRAFQGMGSAGFRYYAPLAYVIAALLQGAGLSVAWALKGTVFLFTLVGAWGMRRLLESMGLPRHAGKGVLLFLCLPPLHIHLSLLFFFQNLCAVLLLPWVLRGWYVREHDSWGLFQGSFWLGIIGLTHLPTALMAGYTLSFLAIFHVGIQKNWLTLRDLITILVASFGIMAPYVFPVLATYHEVNFGLLESITPWKNFTFVDCLEPVISPGGDFQNLWMIVRFMFGATGGLLFGLGLWAAFYHQWRKDGKRLVLFPWLGVFFLFCLFTLKASTWFWKNLPGLAILQFPWRLAFPALILLIPLVLHAYDDEIGEGPWKRMKPILMWALLSGLIGVTVACVWIYAPVFPDRNPAEIPYYPREYLPAACHADHSTPGAVNGQSIEVVDGVANATIQKPGTRKTEWTLQVGTKQALLRILTHWDPYWRLRINGRPLAILPLGTCCSVCFLAAQGSHHLELYREPPPFRGIGWGTAFFTLGILMLLSLNRKMMSKSASVQSEQSSPKD
jgi:hypothetical protein